MEQAALRARQHSPSVTTMAGPCFFSLGARERVTLDGSSKVLTFGVDSSYIVMEAVRTACAGTGMRRAEAGAITRSISVVRDIVINMLAKDSLDFFSRVRCFRASSEASARYGRLCCRFHKLPSLVIAFDVWGGLSCRSTEEQASSRKQTRLPRESYCSPGCFVVA